MVLSGLSGQMVLSWFLFLFLFLFLFRGSTVVWDVGNLVTIIFDIDNIDSLNLSYSGSPLSSDAACDFSCVCKSNGAVRQLRKQHKYSKGH